MLTVKGEATRQRIIEGAAAEVRVRGVADTSLDDVRARTNTSKSQLFHYFPAGRDDLLLAVARHEADQVLSDQQPHLGRLTTWRAWRSWRDAVVERYIAQGQHCPMSVLVSQLRGSAANEVVADLMRRWQAHLADGIRAMQEQGKVAAALDADRHAAALLAGLQGGVVILLATGDPGALAAALDLGIQALRDAR